MRIFVSHPSTFDYTQKLYKPLMDSTLSKEHEFIFPHEHAKHGEYSKELIASCGLLLAEVSQPSLGVGIEIGWANAANITVMCIHQNNTTPSASLRHITDSIHTYKNSAELVALVTAELSNS